MTTSKSLTRQQLAGWILAFLPATMFIGNLFNLPAVIHNASTGTGFGIGQATGFLITACMAIGLLLLATGLIRNDIYCRPAMAVWAGLGFSIGFVVPILGFLYPRHGSLVMIWEIQHPGPIHYAFFFSIFFVLFGIPLWLLLRRPTAPAFRAAHKTA